MSNSSSSNNIDYVKYFHWSASEREDKKTKKRFNIFSLIALIDDYHSHKQKFLFRAGSLVYGEIKSNK